VLDDPAQKREVLEEIPLGRWGTVDDIAKAIAGWRRSTPPTSPARRWSSTAG
jgi:hypothetical protein